MSFGLSREECAQLVAEEAYSLWRSLMVNPERITEWPYASVHEKKRWIEHGRRVMLLVGPSIALDTLLDAKQIVVKPAPLPENWRTVVYQRAVNTTVEKFRTALNMKIQHITSDTDGVSRARREAFAEVGEWIDFIAESIMNQKLSLAGDDDA